MKLILIFIVPIALAHHNFSPTKNPLKWLPEEYNSSIFRNRHFDMLHIVLR